MRADDFDLTTWIEESRKISGVPPKVEDPTALARIMALLTEDDVESDAGKAGTAA